MRMAVTATPSPLTMYGTDSASSFSLNDAGPLTLGSAAMTMGGSSTFYNYSDSSFGTPWDSLYTSGSIFNTPALSAFSDSSEYSSDLQPLDSEEFFQQISGCSPIISTMHPNLVSTLKNMVAPGQISQSSEMCNSAFLDISPHSHLEQDQSQYSDTIAFLRQSVVVPKVELQDLTTTVGAVLPSHPKVEQESPKAAEKSETEDIEAAVVSVDLIKNKRPFKCQHDGCNKTFKNPQTMKMHHKTHYSDGSAASKECTLPSSLKAGHNKKIPSRCPKCKETFVGLYELRRHYGRKHSEGEKPFGCRKCDKKFYIEVDVRDHEKLCGEPIECRCGLKFAFKCNLVAHKKAHPACQDQQVSSNISNSTSNSTSSDDSENNKNQRCNQRGAGNKRLREDTTSQSGLPIPLPDFKGVPEAPREFKLARHDLFGPLELSNMSWASNMVYPTISFANLPVYNTTPTKFQDHRVFPFSNFNQGSVVSTKPSTLEAVNCATGGVFNNSQFPFKARSG